MGDDGGSGSTGVVAIVVIFLIVLLILFFGWGRWFGGNKDVKINVETPAAK
jgi:hypothetical protein